MVPIALALHLIINTKLLQFFACGLRRIGGIRVKRCLVANPQRVPFGTVMGIAWCDRLAVDEAIFVDASVDRVAVGGLYITATVGLYVPARILVARGFIIGVFAVPRLRRFNRSGIDDIDATFSHDDMFCFKLAVHFAQ